MTFRQLSLPLFLCMVLISSCELSSPESSLWFYTYSDGDYTDEPLKPSNFLYLMQDGSYTCDFGNFDYGKWEKNGKNIVLTNTQRQIDVLTIVQEKGDKMQFRMKGALANFEAKPSDFTGIQDPFSLAMNEWRIPAKAKESSAQIKKRLINHCRFWSAYFAWGDEMDLRTLDVRSTPTPFKIYGNGVGLKPYDELPAEWKGYFHDTTDCYHATDILRTIFKKHDIEWPKTDNKFKIFLSTFKQVEDFLKKEL